MVWRSLFCGYSISVLCDWIMLSKRSPANSLYSRSIQFSTFSSPLSLLVDLFLRRAVVVHTFHAYNMQCFFLYFMTQLSFICIQISLALLLENYLAFRIIFNIVRYHQSLKGSSSSRQFLGTMCLRR